MKQTIKLGIILIILLSLLCFAGCSIDPSDYSVASYNIVWTECEGEIGTDYLPTRVYYQIDGISTKQYIGCKYRDKGIGADEYPVLMKHKEFVNSFEFNISSAKLILSKSGRIFLRKSGFRLGKISLFKWYTKLTLLLQNNSQAVSSLQIIWTTTI